MIASSREVDAGHGGGSTVLAHVRSSRAQWGIGGGSEGHHLQCNFAIQIVLSGPSPDPKDNHSEPAAADKGGSVSSAVRKFW